MVDHMVKCFKPHFNGCLQGIQVPFLCRVIVDHPAQVFNQYLGTVVGTIITLGVEAILILAAVEVKSIGWL